MLLLLVIIAVALYFLDKYSIKHAFDGVGYDIKPGRTLVEIDEEFLLETTLSNTKRLPMAFLKTAEILPDEMILSGGKFDLSPYQRGAAFVSNTYLLPRQKLTRTLTAALPRRGRYFLSGATLTAGSFTGLTEKSQDFHLLREIVVPPKAVETPQLNLMLGRFIGDVSVNRFTLEDPVLTIGFRDYTDRDPMRSISWKQTARFGKLMVKNYDHTLDLSVTIIVNVDMATGDPKKELETIFSLARTVCDFLENSEIPYRFVANANSVDGAGSKSYIPDGLGGEHLVAVLKLLGRATYNYFESCTETLAKAARAAEAGRAHILLTPEVPPAADIFLHKLRARTGREILVITPETVKNFETETSIAV